MAQNSPCPSLTLAHSSHSPFDASHTFIHLMLPYGLIVYGTDSPMLVVSVMLELLILSIHYLSCFSYFLNIYVCVSLYRTAVSTSRIGATSCDNNDVSKGKPYFTRYELNLLHHRERQAASITSGQLHY